MYLSSKHKHACFFYESAEQKNLVIIPFIVEELKRGNIVACFSGIELPLFVKNFDGFLPEGITPYLQKNRLLFIFTGNKERTAINFSSRKIISKLTSEASKLAKKGKGELLFIDDMCWLLPTKNPIKIILSHEAELQALTSQFSIKGICCFNRHTFSKDVLMTALSIHSSIILGTQIYDNLYYEAPQKETEQIDELQLKLQYLENYNSLNKKLEASNKELQLLNGMLSDYIYKFIVLPNGEIRLSYISENFEKITGRTKAVAESIDKWSDIFYQDDFVKIQEFIQQLILTKTVGEIDCRTTSVSGTLKWVKITAFPKFDEQQKRVVSIIGTVKDITKKKNYELNAIESETRLRLIIDNSPIAIAFSYDGITNDGNKAYVKLFGYDDISEIKGTSLINQIAPQCRAEIIERVQKRIAGDDTPQTYESIGLKKNGSQFPFMCSTNRIKFPEGSLTLAFFTDMTDRIESAQKLKEKNEEIESQNEEYKQLNEELLKTKTEIELKAQNLAEAQVIAHLGSYVLDIASGLWTCTEILDEIFGLDKNSLKNIDVWVETLHPDERAIMIDYFMTHILVEKNCFDKEYRIRRLSDHAEKWVYGRGRLELNANGDPIKMIGTIQDITERKHAELLIREKSEEIESQNEEYLSLNEELKENIDKISVINQELTTAKIKAEESDNLKSAFLANMSHEIRTPMNGIIGFSDMLANPNLKKEKQIQFIKIIQDCSNQLLTLIDDLIDIAKIESNQIKINISPTCLNDVLFEVYSLYKSKINPLNIELCFLPGLVDDKSHVNTDVIRLKQIIINLMNNAIKFTNKGQIKFGYVQRNELIEFFIEDTGIGIEKEFHKIIFDRFRQVDYTEKRKFGGTGLGLSISKSLVTLLGGTIWVDSIPNQKTTFYFTIPYEIVNKIDGAAKRIISSEQPMFDRLITILIAEDEIVNYLFFEEIFSDMNVKTIHAQNGEEAIKAIHSNPEIDIVLMDMKMPVMNGIDATCEIKKIKKNIPIIAQTAYALSADKIKAMEAGCDDYITKPINTKQLINKIINLIP